MTYYKRSIVGEPTNPMADFLNEIGHFYWSTLPPSLSLHYYPHDMAFAAIRWPLGALSPQCSVPCQVEHRCRVKSHPMPVAIGETIGAELHWVRKKPDL